MASPSMATAPPAGFSAEGTILRSDYGIEFNMPVGLDGMLIGDKVNIELEIRSSPPPTSHDPRTGDAP